MPQEEQQYDKYWKLTVEYTDINGDLFRNVLAAVIRFIDENELQTIKCTTAKNQELQELVYEINPKKDMASVRKSINQFIKLGFVRPRYKGYHVLTKRFIEAEEQKDRELLFAQIFYEASSFNSSYSKDYTERREINFLLKTLAYNGFLSKEDLIALMVTDITLFPEGYIKRETINENYEYAKSISFEEKKYNQIEYLFKFIKYIPGVVFEDNGIRFKDDKDKIVGQEIIPQRDPIIENIYQNLPINKEERGLVLSRSIIRDEIRIKKILDGEEADRQIKSENAELVEHFSKVRGAERKYDVFLSHSFLDKELVRDLVKMFRDCGYSVYVDWIEDIVLDRETVTTDTASVLKERMDCSIGLSYLATSNVQGSKWCPWELGYFDGKKSGRCCILPVKDDRNFSGQEYLGLYPYVTYGKYENRERSDFWVWQPGTTKYIVLKEWLEGKEPYEH